MRALQSKKIPLTRACELIGYTRSSLYYRHKERDEAVLKMRLNDLAAQRPRWGWRRLLIMIRRDKIDVGERRFRRIYRELGLKVRPRRKRHVRYVRGNAIAPVHAPNERWSLDFMHDTLAGGRKIRTLMVIDDFTRECLAIAVSTSFSSKAVIRVLEAIEFDNGVLPKTLRFDNGPELTSRAMLLWGAERNINLHFIDPGKPTQNGHVESFNGKARDEFLNLHCFLTIDQARDAAEAWRIDYNEIRPHSSLANLTPKEFVEALKITQPSQLAAA